MTRLRKFLNREKIAVTSTPALLKGLLAGAAFKVGTNVVRISNLATSTGILYWGRKMGASAPADNTELHPIPIGMSDEIIYDTPDLELIYVAGDGSQSAVVTEDFEY